MELWRQLGHAMSFPSVQCLLATSQEELQEEYANLVKDLFHYVNKEITNFKHNVVPLGDSLWDITINITQVREIA